MKILERDSFIFCAEHDYTVVYNPWRKMWRVYTYHSRSNWNANLMYCTRSLKSTENTYTRRSLHEYRQAGSYHMFFMNEPELEGIRTYEDFKDKYIECFV